MKNMRTLSLADKSLFELLIGRNPSPSCERCFSSDYLWKSNSSYTFADWRGRAVLHRRDARVMEYPLGDDTPPELLLELAEQFRCVGIETEMIYDAPPDYFRKFPDASKYFSPLIDEKYFDYLYELEKLSRLNGALLRKKRNHIRHFVDSNPDWREEKLSASNFAAVREFMCSAAASSEREPMQKAFDNFDSLGLGGQVLYACKNRIVGAAIFGRITPDVWSVHFEKNDKTCEGAAQMMVKLEALDLVSRGAKFMNREQDLGLPNLRQAKRSLDPIMFERMNLLLSKR